MFGYNVGALMSYMKTASLLQRGAQVYASRKARFIDIIPTEDFPEKTSFISTDEVSDYTYTEVDQAIQAADDYLDAVEPATPKVGVIPIKTVDTYDFASLYGLTGASPKTEEKDQVESSPTELFEPEPMQTEPDPVIIEEPVKPEPVKPEPVKPEPVKPEPVKPEPVKPEPVKPVVITPEPVKPDPVAVKSTPVQPVIAKPEPVKPVAKPAEPSPPVTPSIPDITGMNFKTQAQTIAKWYAKPLMLEADLFEAFGKTVIMRLVGEGYLVRTKKGILLGS